MSEIAKLKAENRQLKENMELVELRAENRQLKETVVCLRKLIAELERRCPPLDVPWQPIIIGRDIDAEPQITCAS